MALTVTHKKIQKVSTEGITEVEDLIAVEEPLEIKLNYLDLGIPIEKNISVTMRTPGFDFELATGFLFTEGIITSPLSIDSVA
jgi:FdhD protein